MEYNRSLSAPATSGPKPAPTNMKDNCRRAMAWVRRTLPHTVWAIAKGEIKSSHETLDKVCSGD